jgi:hypothetical protein
MKKHQKTKPKPESPKPLYEPVPDAPGIDPGATEIWVALWGRIVASAGREI